MPEEPETDELSNETMRRLVSPHGFDGRGPVPAEVTAAAKRIAHLRTRFMTRPPLTSGEVDDLFEASAVCAEWTRELYEAVASEVEARRRIRAFVDEQAEDEGLWFMAQTAPEAYLQQELRRLHSVIEDLTSP